MSFCSNTKNLKRLYTSFRETFYIIPSKMKWNEESKTVLQSFHSLNVIINLIVIFNNQSDYLKPAYFISHLASTHRIKNLSNKSHLFSKTRLNILPYELSEIFSLFTYFVIKNENKLGGIYGFY